MRTLPKITVASVIAMTALVSSASAMPIRLDPSGVAYPASGGSTTIADWLDDVVDAYNVLHATILPDPGPELVGVNSGDTPPTGYPLFGSGTLSITIPTDDYNYLVFHWGGKIGAATLQAWYIGAEPGGSSWTFDAPSRNGLSFYRLYGENHRQPPVDDLHPDAVPEPASAVLVAGGVAVAALVARRKNRA